MNKNLEEISDGKRYGLNDMVRAACNDCAGCSSCCEDMGESIILDPLDIYELTKILNRTSDNLFKEQIELHVADGMILANLKMTDKNVCPFLKEKSCSIHITPFRNASDLSISVGKCADSVRQRPEKNKKYEEELMQMPGGYICLCYYSIVVCDYELCRDF